MKCTIPGPNVKVFGRAIHSLAKLGEELYLEATEQGLNLKTVNSSRSAFACFTFTPTFFTHYTDTSTDARSEDGEEEDFLKCKIPVKSCLTVFKSLSTLDKTVDKCRIKLDMDESRLVFQLHCKHGIVKTYNLAFIECETLQAVFSKDMCPNILVAQAKLLCEVVINFQTSQEEVSLIVDPEKTRFKNYVEDEPDPNKVIHTELTLLPEEFDNYQVGIDTEVTFCLKELRAILAFAESSNLPLSLHFETAGKPIVFAMGSDPTFEGNFVLATLADKSGDTQSSQRPAPVRQSAPAPSTVKKTISVRKQATSSHSNHSTSSHAANTTDTSKAGGDNNHNSLINKHRLMKESRARVEAAFKDLCEDNMDDEMTAGDLEAIDRAAAEHLAESSQTSDPVVNYPQLKGLGNGKAPRQHQDDQDEDDLQGSPVIPVYSRNKVAPAPPVSTTGSSSSSKALFQSTDVEQEEDDDCVPGTPPSKKFRAMFSGLSQSTIGGSQRSAAPTVLAEDSDDD